MVTRVLVSYSPEDGVDRCWDATTNEQLNRVCQVLLESEIHARSIMDPENLGDDDFVIMFDSYLKNFEVCEKIFFKEAGEYFVAFEIFKNFVKEVFSNIESVIEGNAAFGNLEPEEGLYDNDAMLREKHLTVSFVRLSFERCHVNDLMPYQSRDVILDSYTSFHEVNDSQFVLSPLEVFFRACSVFGFGYVPAIHLFEDIEDY